MFCFNYNGDAARLTIECNYCSGPGHHWVDVTSGTGPPTGWMIDAITHFMKEHPDKWKKR